jgi:predicted RNA-binding Zn-ribbon protein involved in translation (DUF1610 family)
MISLPDSMYDYRYESPKATIVDSCIMCGRNIRIGEKYYSFPDVVCKDCLDEYTENFKSEE